ncbi:outer membrane protein beta-barrel family protein [Kordia sp. SMS9]|uniref:outer membrane beta-barrel family protein n=1 Tax=Kordia sp. SMS9 TaxID=2282170 RepID=UPI000E0D5D7A|nr:outer membrane beta-barrel family protein [Kordia sp. SMS9]AXG71693.1 outer membrane protein beta-barrel family protein [Kordia sp. SMS9]
MYAKTTFYTLLTLLFFSLRMNSQTQETTLVTGKIVSETNEILPFVNVLVNTLDGALVKATISNENGLFTLKDIAPKTYMLKISFVGYTTLSREITLGTKKNDLGTIIMSVSAESLEAVTVVAEKPIIQVEPDKTVFNVASMVGSAGNNGLEILRKAPGVRLDNDNNIVVEGKAGVLIYIDDRQSFLAGDDLTAFLQSLQADTIESIEIITQPSSKYDAAGNAGIINIKLKREKGLGTRGSVSSTVTVGDYARTNNSVSINSRFKKWTFFGSYSNFFGRSTGFINLFRTQGDKIFDAQTDSENDAFSNNFRTGADYYLSKESVIGTVVSVNLRDAASTSNSVTPIIDRNTRVTDSILRAPNSSENNSFNLNANVNYRYKDTLGTSFSVDLDYGRYTRERFNNQPNFYTTPTGEILNANITYQETPIDINIYAAKVDYGQKLGKGSFEAGAKVSKVITDNTFNFFDVINGVNNLNMNRSNEFEYDEKIYALYAKYNFALDKWKFQAGLRMERTDSQGELTAENTDQNQVVSRQYTDFFPSAGISYQANATNSLALSYSRRIQRPNYQILNPFEFQLDELSFSRGNPFLQPQYTDNFKISHTYKYTLTTSFSYSYISDFFAQVTEAEGENRNFLNTRNVADQEVYNLSISYPFKVNNWWRAYANVYGLYTKFTATNPAFITIDQNTFGFYAQTTFSLPKEIKLEVSGWYSSPSIWGGTYETQSLGSLNIAVQKSWGNWTGKITMNDVLYTIPWQGVTQFGDLRIDGRGGSDSRNINFYVRYSFGNSDVKNAKKRDGSLEDEKGRIGG